MRIKIYNLLNPKVIMANVLLDTNIYGEIIEDSQGDKLVEEIIKRGSFIIHDFKIIRDEVKNAPEQVLQVYNRIVKTELFADNSKIDKLAEEYFGEYKLLKGVQDYNSIIKDFKIIAYASLKNCDLVFSNDEKTMKNPIAREAYKIINLRRNIRTPTFYTYSSLKRSLLG